MSALLREFKEFAVKGNVIDLAVGVVIGTAFSKIVTSLVNDVIMPPLGLLLGKVDFSNLYLNLSGKSYDSLSAAKAAGAATLNYGVFLNTLLEFLIVGFAVFMLVKQVNRIKKLGKKHEAALPNTKDCPFCLTNIPLEATKCAACTSVLP